MESPEDLLPYIETLAPQCKSRISLSHVLSATLDLEWTDAKWRGVWKSNPRLTCTAEKLLGQDIQPNTLETLTITEPTRGAIVYDIHSPYFDLNAIDLAAKVIKWYRPDTLVWGGDENDFYNVSSFDKDPRRKYTIQEEIDEWHTKAASVLQAAMPTEHKEYMVGSNHFDRLRRFVWRNPGIFGIRALEVHKLLELDRLNIQFVEKWIRFGDALHVMHGERFSQKLGSAIEGHLRDLHYSIAMCMGHVHRSARFQGRQIDGWIYGWEVPALCSLDAHYKTFNNWSQGIALFEYVPGKPIWFDVIDFTADYTARIGKKEFYL